MIVKFIYCNPTIYQEIGKNKAKKEAREASYFKSLPREVPDGILCDGKGWVSQLIETRWRTDESFKFEINFSKAASFEQTQPRPVQKSFRITN